MQSAQLRQIGTNSGSGASDERKERYGTHRKVLKGIILRHVPCGASERIRSAAQQTFHGPEQQALIRRPPHNPIVHWRCESMLSYYDIERPLRASWTMISCLTN